MQQKVRESLLRAVLFVCNLLVSPAIGYGEELLTKAQRDLVNQEKKVAQLELAPNSSVVVGLLSADVERFALYEISTDVFDRISALYARTSDQIVVEDARREGVRLKLKGETFSLKEVVQSGKLAAYERGVRNFRKVPLTPLKSDARYLLHVGAADSGVIALLSSSTVNRRREGNTSLSYFFAEPNDRKPRTPTTAALFLLSTTTYDGLVRLAGTKQYTNAGPAVEEITEPLAYLRKLVDAKVIKSPEVAKGTESLLALAMGYLEVYATQDIEAEDSVAFLALYNLSLRDYLGELRHEDRVPLTKEERDALKELVVDYQAQNRSRKLGDGLAETASGPSDEQKVKRLATLTPTLIGAATPTPILGASSPGATSPGTLTTALPAFATVNGSYQAPIVCNSPFLTHPHEGSAAYPGVYCHGANILNIPVGPFTMTYHSRASTAEANLWGFSGFLWAEGSVIDSGFRFITEGITRKELVATSPSTFKYRVPGWGRGMTFTRIGPRTVQARAAGSDVVYTYTQIWSSPHYHLKTVTEGGSRVLLEVFYSSNLSPSRINYLVDDEPKTDTVTVTPDLVTITAQDGWHAPIRLSRSTTGGLLTHIETTEANGSPRRTTLSYAANRNGQSFLTGIETTGDASNSRQVFFGYDSRGVVLGRGAATNFTTFSYATNATLGMTSLRSYGLNRTIAFRLTGPHGLVTYYTDALGEAAIRYGEEAKGYPITRIFHPGLLWFEVTEIVSGDLVTTRITNTTLGTEERSSSTTDAGFLRTKRLLDRSGNPKEEQRVEFTVATDTLKTTRISGETREEFQDIAGTQLREVFLKDVKLVSVRGTQTESTTTVEDLLNKVSLNTHLDAGEDFDRITQQYRSPLGVQTDVYDLSTTSQDGKSWSFDGEQTPSALRYFTEKQGNTTSIYDQVAAPGGADQWWRTLIKEGVSEERSSGLSTQPGMPQ